MAENATSPSVGDYLRTLREGKQVSIEEMARETRVGSRQLEALEAEQWVDLPAPVFVKGFIRAYCHVLGEPDEEALQRYREMLGERPLPERGAPAPRAHGGHWSASPVFISFVLLILFGGGLLTLNLVFRRGPQPTVPSVAPAVTSQPAPPAPSPITSPAPITPAVAVQTEARTESSPASPAPPAQ